MPVETSGDGLGFLDLVKLNRKDSWGVPKASDRVSHENQICSLNDILKLNWCQSATVVEQPQQIQNLWSNV